MCNPDWVAEPYRQIARLAGAAHGTVGWVMADLPDLGFVAEIDGERRLLKPDPLIYADLLNIGDTRCLEAVDLIYEKIVDGFKR